MMTLFQTLQAADRSPLPGQECGTVEGLVLRYGRNFRPQPKPRHVHVGNDRMCFVNAFVLAHRPHLTYCEGFATDRSGTPQHHAWACDHKGRVIDNTWESPGLEYFGVPFSRPFLYQLCCDRGVVAPVFGYRAYGIGNDDWLKYGLPEEAVRRNLHDPSRHQHCAVA